jgi:hypothetical protein
LSAKMVAQNPRGKLNPISVFGHCSSLNAGIMRAKDITSDRTLAPNPIQPHSRDAIVAAPLFARAAVMTRKVRIHG